MKSNSESSPFIQTLVGDIDQFLGGSISAAIWRYVDLRLDHDLDGILTPELHLEGLGSPVQGKPMGDELPAIDFPAPEKLDGGRKISPQTASKG